MPKRKRSGTIVEPDSGSLGSEEGNISPPLIKRCSPNKSWFFTYHSELDHIPGIDQVIAQCDKFVAQYERGELTGALHWQGCLVAKERIRPIEKFGHILPKASWERTKNQDAAESYCQKTKTKVGPRIIHGVDERWDPLIVPPMMGLRWKPWQVALEAELEKIPDRRTIMWVADTKGGRGKSVFTEYICDHLMGTVVNGVKRDAFCALTQLVEKRRFFKTVVVDLARQTDPKTFSYETLEILKNGRFFNEKYESQMVKVGLIHVVVMANFFPDYKKISEDRIKLFDLNEKNLTDED